MMKVFEIFKDTVPPTEAELKAILARLDWSYEFSDSEYTQQKGQKMMEHAENLMYSFYKKKPEKALTLWKKYCPYAKNLSEGIEPDFITRFRLIESNGK